MKVNADYLFWTEGENMSTTFVVYAHTTIIPSFESVISLSNQYLKETLEKNNISKNFVIDVSIIKNETHDIVHFDRTSPAVWSDDEYAWFNVLGQPGGCDAYYEIIDEFDFVSWEGEFESNERAKKIRTQNLRMP